MKGMPADLWTRGVALPTEPIRRKVSFTEVLVSQVPDEGIQRLR